METLHQSRVNATLDLQQTSSQIIRLSQEFGMVAKARAPIELSIVVPVYNEAARLPKTMLETITWCREFCRSFEIIIVDDGSSDQTLEIARLFADHFENVSCLACPHLGKGAAVRTGMLNAAGKDVLFMDADGATPLQEIPKLMGTIGAGNQIAIGSRIVQDGGETRVVTSLHRKVIGRLFAAIVRIFGVSGIADTQCGFKMFRKEVVRDIFGRQKLNGFAFDVEILLLAAKFGFKVSEVPINWSNKEGSKVDLMFDSIRMLRDVLRVNFLHRKVKPSPR